MNGTAKSAHAERRGNIRRGNTETDRERIEEDKKVRQLQRVVDFTCCVLRQQPMSLEEAQRLIRGVRKMALHLFPEKGETFDIIYGSRFRRILMEKFPIS